MSLASQRNDICILTDVLNVTIDYTAIEFVILLRNANIIVSIRNKSSSKP